MLNPPLKAFHSSIYVGVSLFPSQQCIYLAAYCVDLLAILESLKKCANKWYVDVEDYGSDAIQYSKPHSSLNPCMIQNLYFLSSFYSTVKLTMQRSTNDSILLRDVL